MVTLRAPASHPEAGLILQALQVLRFRGTPAQLTAQVSIPLKVGEIAELSPPARQSLIDLDGAVVDPQIGLSGVVMGVSPRRHAVLPRKRSLSLCFSHTR